MPEALENTLDPLNLDQGNLDQGNLDQGNLDQGSLDQEGLSNEGLYNENLEPEELRVRIREELEAEHLTRVERFETKRKTARKQGQQRSDSQRLRALEDLREEERRRFYVDKGYRKYTDSNGRHVWLPAEEYAWRMKRRKRRDKTREYRPALWRRRQALMMYGVAAFVAIAIGLLLVR